MNANELDLAKASDIANFVTKSVDDLVNYYTKTQSYTKTEVDNIVSAIENIHFEVVNALPTEDIQTNVIYLVPSASSLQQNVKDEYINIDGTTSGWEIIGSTAVDLSNYVTVNQLNTALSFYTTTTNLTALLADKQDVLQVASMPTASALTMGKVYQFVGLTDYAYTHGYFYETIESDGSYSWTRVNVQPNEGGGYEGYPVLFNDYAFPKKCGVRINEENEAEDVYTINPLKETWDNTDVVILTSPLMTSANAPSPYSVTVSSNYGNNYIYWKVFTDIANRANVYDCWCSSYRDSNAGWIQLDMGEPVLFNTMKIQTASYYSGPRYALKNWNVTASNDQNTFVTLLPYPNIHITGDELFTFDFETSGYYRYYRFNILNSSGADATVGRIQFLQIGDQRREFGVDKILDQQTLYYDENRYKVLFTRKQ